MYNILKCITFSNHVQEYENSGHYLGRFCFRSMRCLQYPENIPNLVVRCEVSQYHLQWSHWQTNRTFHANDWSVTTSWRSYDVKKVSTKKMSVTKSHITTLQCVYSLGLNCFNCSLKLAVKGKNTRSLISWEVQICILSFSRTQTHKQKVLSFFYVP